MKVYVVFDHQDNHETGRVVLVTTDYQKADEEHSKHTKRGLSPLIEEHEVIE